MATKKELQAEIRRHKKEVLPKLREALKAAKREKKKRVRACRDQAARGLAELRKKQKQARAKLAVHLRKLDKQFEAGLNLCIREESARALDKVEDVTRKIAEEREEIMRLRRLADAAVSPVRRAAGRRAAEKRMESEDEVRRNLETPALRELWELKKAKVRGSKYRTRTEAFLDWVHDHPEALEELQHKAERKHEAEIAKAFEERAAGRTCDIELDDCQRELERLREALRLAEQVPF